MQVNVILIIFSTFTLLSLPTISSDLPCPAEKPYSSDVGCVFECPDSFYINGTRCVGDCGDLYVDGDRNCLETCPSGTYPIETLKFALSIQYLEKKCVQCTDNEGLIFNSTCLKMCPKNWRYILPEHNQCVHECPSGMPFIQSRVIFNITHYRCQDSCLHFNIDSRCVDYCPDNRLAHEKSCVTVCPSTSPFIWGKSCKSSCPHNHFASGPDNLTCVWPCPVDKPFIFNNTCVENCPHTFPFIQGNMGLQYCVEHCLDGSCCPPNAPYFLAVDNCVENCPDGLSFSRNQHCVNTCLDDEFTDYKKKQCLTVCPSLALAANKTCVSHCPELLPFSCKTKAGQVCGDKNEDDLRLFHSVCVVACPDHMYLWIHSCLHECPTGKVHFKRECVEVCPNDSPLLSNVTETDDCQYNRECSYIKVVTMCVRECPANQFLYNNVCYDFCPVSLFQYENICTSKCDKGAPLQQNTTIHVTAWGKTVYQTFIKLSEAKIVTKCVPSCETKYMLFNDTCVGICPSIAPFIYNGTCQNSNCSSTYMKHTKAGIICVDECDTFTTEQNNTCLDRCPDDHFVFNKTCVSQCPQNHTITVKSTYQNCEGKCDDSDVYLTCVEECPPGMFLMRNACVPFCPTPLFTFKNECLTSCPVTHSFINITSIKVRKEDFRGHLNEINENKQKTVCVSACPNETLYVNNSKKCHDGCPSQSRYIYNNLCSSKPCQRMFSEETEPKGILCRDSCPANMFRYMQKCLKECPNGMFALLNRDCVTNCSLYLNEEEEAVGGIVSCRSLLSLDFGNISCSSSVILVKQCLEKCPGYRYTFKKSCLLLCPPNTFAENNTCRNECSAANRFHQPETVEVKKWDKDIFYGKNCWFLHFRNNSHAGCHKECQDGYYQSGNSTDCVKSCKEPYPFYFGNICVQTCPAQNLVDLSKNACVDKCPENSWLFNGSCYKNCPKEFKYIHDSVCVASCPTSAPFGMKNDHYFCRKSCDDDKLFRNDECIKQFECSDPFFEFRGECINICPSAYVLFVSCNSVIAISLGIAFLVTQAIATAVQGRHVLKEFFMVLRLRKSNIYTIQRKMWQNKDMCRKLSASPVRNSAKCNKHGDEMKPLLEDISKDTWIDIDDETSF